MGNCIHCKKEINLKDGEKNCPSCGLPPYNCWKCKTEITGETKECDVCKFFICPVCSWCSRDCKLPELMLLSEGLSRREIILMVYKSITTPERKQCPKGIPISYGHGKLRNMVLRLQGLIKKNDNDTDAFEKRFEKIIEFDVGKTWSITEAKEDGQYGIEWRENSNLAVCMGKAKKQIKDKLNKKGKKIGEYEIFERVNIEPCEFQNWDKLMVKYCLDCKTTHANFATFCECGRELIQRKSKVQFCSMTRKSYQTKKPAEKNG